MGVSLGSVFKHSVNFCKQCNLLDTEKKVKVAKRIKSVTYLKSSGKCNISKVLMLIELLLGSTKIPWEL